ncbi:MAG: pyridoxal-phosphate dependent enzyme, partial [Exilispira sp.]
ICSQCGKIYPIEKERYLCDECSKNQLSGKPLSGILLTEFSSSFAENFLENLNLKKNYLKKSIEKISSKFLNKDKNNIIYNIKPIFPFDNLPDLPVGNTPLLYSERFAKILEIDDLYLKWEGANLSGSFKDRASILVSAVAKKFDQENIVVASTGNAASSMAAIGAANNQNIYIFAPSSAPSGKLAQILQYGAKLFLIDGTYDDAFELSMQFARETGFLSRNTGFNPFTIEGKKSVAYELLIKNDNNNYLCTFDIILVPVGDGVIISGVIKGFLELKKLGIIDKLPTVIGVQAEGSSYIYNAFTDGIFEENYSSKTIADSISVNSPRCGYLAVDLVKKTGGFFIKVKDYDILIAQHLLAKNTGIFSEPSSAATIAAILKDNKIFKWKKVVALITGHGLKDINSALQIIQKPEPVKNNFNAVMDFYKKIIK